MRPAHDDPAASEPPIGSPPDGAVAVVLVTGSRLLTECLEAALRPYPQVRLVASATRDELVAGALAQLATQPEVLLIDSHCTAPLAPADVQHLHPATRLRLVVTSLPEDPQVVLEWAELGAVGLLTSQAGVDDLVRALLASQGEAICSPSITAMLLGNIRSETDQRRTWEPHGLTRRERQVARLLERGLSNKELARELDISVSTVKNHVHSVLTKLEIANRGRVHNVRSLPRSRSLRVPRPRT